jgi:hypothetical protein
MDLRTTKFSRSLVIAAVAVLVACAWLPRIQALADAQVDAGLKRALISFASARTLNGLISVLQGTEVSMQPLGVGVTLTVGQALDPINDLIEQFSTMMLYASVAFGVQKALLAIGGHWAMTWLVTGVAIVWAGLYAMRKSPPWLSRVLVVLLMIRFAIPVVTLGSDFLYRQMLADKYALQQAAIETVSDVIERSTPSVSTDGAQRPSTTTMAPRSGAPPQAAPAAKPASAADKGWFERLADQVTPGTTGPETSPGQAAAPAAGPDQGWMGRLKDRVVGAVPIPDLDAIKASVEGLPERIVGLIVIFLLQTMIIPIFLLWVLYRLALSFALAKAS